MKANEKLQADVQKAIKWEPLLHAAEIGVSVKDGIVTLSGSVDNYYKKTEAESATKKVAGVKAVVEKITVYYPTGYIMTNQEIAENAVKVLKDNWSVPNDKVQVTVEGGYITLDGELTWNYQKEAAKTAVSRLTGVKDVTNNIKIKTSADNEVEKQDVKDAFKRHWSINTTDVAVAAKHHTVTLTGAVTSLYQKEEAGRIAWNTPGVWMVENELKVEHDHSLVE